MEVEGEADMGGRMRGAGIVGLLAGLGACRPPQPALPPPAPVTLAILPAEATVTAGREMQFGYRIRGAEGVAWRLVEPGGGTVDAQGRYRAPAQAGTWTVEVRALADPARTARARVTVVPPPSGPISAPGTVAPDATDLRASVPAQPGARYAWHLDGGTILGGAEAEAVTFQAGAGPTLTLRCRITNAAGDAHTESLEVPVAAPLPLVLAPAQAILTVGRAMTFGLTRAAGSGEVLWRVADAGGGTVDGKGTYHAPDVPGVYTLQAVPEGRPGAVAQARIEVVAAPEAPIRTLETLVAGQAGCTARVPVQRGARYAWEVSGGTLTAGGTGPVATFTVGQGPTLTLRCTVTNEAGDTFTGSLVLPVRQP